MSSVRASNRGSSLLIAVIAAALIACWTRGARAEDIPIVCDGNCQSLVETGRVLGGHRYVRFSIVDWAFVDSEFATTSSFGVYRLDQTFISRSTTGDEGPRLEFIALAQTFEGAAALAPWLGFHVRATGTSVIATDRDAALGVGAQALAGGGGGLTLRLIRSGHFQLSAVGDATWGRNEGVVPDLLPSSPRIERDIWTARPALAAALTLGSRVGVQASGSFEWRHVDGQAERAKTWSAALGLSLALDPVPFLLLAGARYSQQSEQTPEAGLATLVGRRGTVGTAEGGLFFHGRTDLELGIALQFAFADDDRRYVSQARMTYYF